MAGSISYKKWDSRTLLQNHLTESDSRSLIVGADSEAPSAFYSFSIDNNDGSNIIGVVSSGFGTDPAAIIFERDKVVLVGHDLMITWIDMKLFTIAKEYRLGGVFYDFLQVNNENEIVVLHELGALRTNAEGLIKWSVNTDVVENSYLDGKEKLVLEIMDGTRLSVSLFTGDTL